MIALLVAATAIQAQDAGIQWIEVNGGTFTMGSGSAAREVTLGSFYMSATEVTFGQYDVYCKATGVEQPDDNGWGRDDRPVINVSWDDAVGFCRWLSKATGSEIRLPDEAEWEYAALGGGMSKGYTYSGSNNWNEVSWSQGDSGERTRPVGGRKPNELGLYDMSGNVWEWCADWPPTDESSSRADRKSTGGAIERAARGDSFDNPASNPRLPAVRIESNSRHYNIGFRIAKTKNQKK